MATQPFPKLTEHDYLALDRAADFKSEFVDGEMYAMSGGTFRHGGLAVNLVISLGTQLRGSHFRVFNSDVRVRTAKKGSYLYPDLSVVCGPIERFEGADDILANPVVIGEVLFPSTADHGTKFEIYREIPALMDHLLVHSDEMFIEHFTRQPDGNWLLSDHKGTDAFVELPSTGCRITLVEIYEGTEAPLS